MTVGAHTVGFKFFDDTTYLSGASGVVHNTWQTAVSSTGFKMDTEEVSNLSGSYLYTHGQSLPYITNIKIQINNSAVQTYYLNRPHDNDDGSHSGRTNSASSLTLFDIS